MNWIFRLFAPTTGCRGTEMRFNLGLGCLVHLWLWTCLLKNSPLKMWTNNL